MLFSTIIKYFNDGNVSVCGLRGRGKDMLMSNVVVRRNLPYISNTDYGGTRYPLDFNKLNCGGNTYKDFIEGTLKNYKFPYPDHTDVYLGDAGVYLPSQYCNEINRDYKFIATYIALSRHLGQSNFHYNVQNLNRCFDKIREQSDTFINCRYCIVLFGKIVIQGVRIYERYESCVNNVPPFRVTAPLLSSPQTKTQVELMKQSYESTHGQIKSGLLIYWNKSKYNTRVFKEILENAP